MGICSKKLNRPKAQLRTRLEVNLKSKILVVDDEVPIQKLLAAALSTDEYELCPAYSAEEGIRLAASNNPDLILLDLGLPNKDGFSLIERVREWSQVPIIILSARTEETDKIRALELGADDYVTKPFGIGELVARMRVCLRKVRLLAGGGESVIKAAGIEIDLKAHTASKFGKELDLTPTEFKLLAVLVRNADKVVTHKALLSAVWGPRYSGDVQYLRVFMKQIRSKIEECPARPKIIQTEAGIGYRLRSAEE